MKIIRCSSHPNRSGYILKYLCVHPSPLNTSRFLRVTGLGETTLPPFGVEESADHRQGWACSYLSLLGVWTESCPLVEACGFMIREDLEGAEDETHVLVRSRLLWLLPVVSSAV